MLFRKPCHKLFRKLIPPITPPQGMLSEENSLMKTQPLTTNMAALSRDWKPRIQKFANAEILTCQVCEAVH